MVGNVSAKVCCSLSKMKKLKTNARIRQKYADKNFVNVFVTVFNIPTYSPNSVALPIININKDHVIKTPYALAWY